MEIVFIDLYFYISLEFIYYIITIFFQDKQNIRTNHYDYSNNFKYQDPIS